MKFYDLVKPSLDKVEKYMEDTLNEQNSYMYPQLLEYLKRGGKRLRPALVFLVLGALSSNQENGVKPASLLEMFHNFTLVHDDIEDDSLMRRGKPTMHISEGLPIAINSGDALYTLVWKNLFQLQLNAEKKNDLGNLLSEAFKKVVEGQATELKWYKDKKVNVSEEEYFEMIGGKTGSLIKASCELGVLISEKNQMLKNFQVYGMNIGLAFQIHDDVLNLVGEEEKYQKEIGGDITEGKRTLMVAHAFENLDENQGKELQEILLSHTRDKEKIKRAIQLINDSDSIGYAKQKSNDLVSEAKKSIESLEDSEYKSALMELADFVINRAH